MAHPSASGGTNDPTGHILGVLFYGIQGLGGWKKWKNVERSGGKLRNNHFMTGDVQHQRAVNELS